MGVGCYVMRHLNSTRATLEFHPFGSAREGGGSCSKGLQEAFEGPVSWPPQRRWTAHQVTTSA